MRLQSAEKQASERIAGFDLGFYGERDDAEFVYRGKRDFLSPLWGFLAFLRPPTAYAVGFIPSPLRG
ncbi:MAG: hypothetical protein WBQ64_06645 [Terriglobales bacterium]